MGNVNISGGVHANTANVNDTTNASFTLVAAVANRKTKLHKLVLSLAAADTITVKSGSTTLLGPLYLGANSGMVYDLFPFHFLGGTNEALTIEKGAAATDVTAQAFYTQDFA